VTRHTIKIIGSDPPCHRCRITEKIVREAALELGFDAEVSHMSANSQEACGYGIMITPAITIDGRLVLSGKVPSKGEMKRILRSLP
jgi:small redox-active disulfide protein 2